MSRTQFDQRIRRQQKQRITLPAALLVERDLDTVYGSNHEFEPSEGLLAHLDALEGYPFAWGWLIERRVDNQLIWAFCLDALLTRCHSRGMRLPLLQLIVFEELKRLMPAWVAEDWAVNSTQLAGWKFYVGSDLSALILRCHFSDETAARDWLSDTFLPQTLPGLLHQVQCHVDRFCA